MRYGLIMAGGAGTRLWPMSRSKRPKQLLPLVKQPGHKGLRSLLEVAADRLEGVVPAERRYICTGEQFRDQIKQALPQFSDDRILGEPLGRDTANAVGFAAAVFHKLHKDAVFVVLTADHLITPEEVMRDRIELGFRLVEQDPTRLVTFSIRPTFAATGYGYVERGPAILGISDAKGKKEIGKGLAFKVARFVEKPDHHRAQAYFESGHFAWNSGMFVFHAATFMDCLKRFKPESHEGLMKIAAAWGTKKQKSVIDEVYPELPRISVDYAVMEPASRDKAGKDGVSVCTVLTDVKWLDVGSWPSYGETLEPDKEGNRVGGAGAAKALLSDSRGTLIVSDDPSHTVAVLGVKDLIVVHTKEATLVMPRDKAEQLKKLHAEVAEELR